MKSYEKYISKNDIENLHEHSLKILSETGVLFENKNALEVFKKLGLKIDNGIVHFDEKTINTALKTVPEKFTMKSFKGDYTIGGAKPVLRPVGSNIYINENGIPRRMTNEDSFKQFKLGDTSDVITNSHINPLTSHEGFTPDQRKFAQMALQMKYANKPTITLYPDFSQMDDNESHRELFRKAILLAKRFEGISDDYILMPMVNSLSPLTYDFSPIEKMFAAIEENQPMWFIPCAMPLLTAPPSIAAMMAQTNAEQLAGIVLAQTIKPGIPVIYGNTSCSTDMRTIQLSIGTPETALVAYATAGLADLYKMPFRTGGSLSDAKNFDIQAGIESMMMLYATFDCGANFVEHACGTMASFNMTSFEKYLIDEEIIRLVQRLLKGIDCSEEKMCMDEIASSGPRGTFLHGRTPKMYRDEFYLSKYLNKQDPNEWYSKGAISVKEVTAQDVQSRLESWTPPSIEKDRLAVIEQYIPEIYKTTI